MDKSYYSKFCSKPSVFRK